MRRPILSWSSTYTISIPSTTPTSHFSTPTRANTPTNTTAPTRTPTLTSTESPWNACPGSYLSHIHIDTALMSLLIHRSLIEFDLIQERVEKTIGRIQPGEEVKVFDGPTCENGWVWWYVRSKETGLTGWTSEGDYENYWLVPLP